VVCARDLRDHNDRSADPRLTNEQATEVQAG
jgi:hypothetical protein